MSTSLTGSRGPAGQNIATTSNGKALKGYDTAQLQQFSPEQMQLFQQLFSRVSPDSNLSKLAGGDEAAFAPYEQQARKDFGASLGQLGSRYSQLAPGAMSAQRGSGFQNRTNQAAQDFSLQLSQQRQGLQRQALMDLMGISESLLGQRPQENFLLKKEPRQSGFAKALGIGLPIAGAAAGAAFGGPAGAALGGNLGSSLASGFNGGSSQANYSGISSLPTSWGS